jgi:hypothetical protein
VSYFYRDIIEFGRNYLSPGAMVAYSTPGCFSYEKVFLFVARVLIRRPGVFPMKSFLICRPGPYSTPGCFSYEKVFLFVARVLIRRPGVFPMKKFSYLSPGSLFAPTQVHVVANPNALQNNLKSDFC